MMPSSLAITEEVGGQSAGGTRSTSVVEFAGSKFYVWFTFANTLCNIQ